MKNKQKKSSIPTRYPLVCVEWADAHSTGSGWMTREDMVDAYHTNDWLIHSVGWLIERNKKYIILASQYDNPDSLYGKTIKIPATWCKITKLVPR